MSCSENDPGLDCRYVYYLEGFISGCSVSVPAPKPKVGGVCVLDVQCLPGCAKKSRFYKHLVLARCD